MPDREWTRIVARQRRAPGDAGRPDPGEHHGHGRGRAVPDPVIRQVLRALGVVTCPACHEVRRIIGPARVVPGEVGR